MAAKYHQIKKRLETEAAEIALIERAKNGDSGAFNDLFLQQQRYVFNLMYQLCGDSAMADDLAQEAFIIAYKKLSNFRLESSFRTWLSRIAINLFREKWRRRPKHVSICLEQIKIPARADAPERTVIKRELQWCIAHSLQQHVPKKYRIVLVLRDLQNLSYKEISEVLGWSLSRTKPAFTAPGRYFAIILSMASAGLLPRITSASARRY